MSNGFVDPFMAMLALQRALESRLESGWIGRGTVGFGTYPPINIFQQGDDFVAIIELPGMDKEQLNIEAKEKTIRIYGEKAVSYTQNASVHRRERVSGVFDRSFALPIQINAEGIRAEYREGVLAVFIPRAESEKPHSIKIN